MLLDVVDALNKVSYKKYGCNIKSTIINMKKNTPLSQWNSHPTFLYQTDRAIYLSGLRNNIGHGAAVAASVTVEDICVILKVAAVALFDRDKRYSVYLREANSDCYVCFNGEKKYDIDYLCKQFRRTKDSHWLVKEIFAWHL